MKIFLSLLFFSQLIFSELVLEITKGSEDPYSIALIEFSGSKKITNEINSIINADLIRTGEFKIFRESQLLSTPTNEEDIKFEDFKLLGIDFIITGSLINEDKFNVSASYQVFNVQKETKIRTSKVFGIPNKLRQLAHYISDGIYEEISGLKGVASTKLLYVTENINDDKTIFKLVVADADGSNEQTLLKSSEPIISPSWSPDSKQVAYVSVETGMAKVFIQTIATGKREMVLENSSQISSPSWSPNGKFLSLTLYQDGNAEIYILNLKNQKFLFLF